MISTCLIFHGTSKTRNLGLVEENYQYNYINVLKKVKLTNAFVSFTYFISKYFFFTLQIWFFHIDDAKICCQVNAPWYGFSDKTKL